ncbi:hypothetical protein BC830DRAFT_575093 [Chytriomyces sp. MP71]|nr:hypothetical protein BC830DRAFT_575093 [Chytriomyces sp. MP71]
MLTNQPPASDLTPSVTVPNQPRSITLGSSSVIDSMKAHMLEIDRIMQSAPSAEDPTIQRVHSISDTVDIPAVFGSKSSSLHSAFVAGQHASSLSRSSRSTSPRRGLGGGDARTIGSNGSGATSAGMNSVQSAERLQVQNILRKALEIQARISSDPERYSSVLHGVHENQPEQPRHTSQSHSPHHLSPLRRGDDSLSPNRRDMNMDSVGNDSGFFFRQMQPHRSELHSSPQKYVQEVYPSRSPSPHTMPFQRLVTRFAGSSDSSVIYVGQQSHIGSGAFVSNSHPFQHMSPSLSSRRGSIDGSSGYVGFAGGNSERMRSLSRARVAQMQHSSDFQRAQQRAREDQAAIVIQRFVRRVLRDSGWKNRRRVAGKRPARIVDADLDADWRWIGKDVEVDYIHEDNTRRIHGMDTTDPYSVFNVLDRVKPGFGDLIMHEKGESHQAEPPSSTIASTSSRSVYQFASLPKTSQLGGSVLSNLSSDAKASSADHLPPLQPSTDSVKAEDLPESPEYIGIETVHLVGAERRVSLHMSESDQIDDSVSYSATFEDEAVVPLESMNKGKDTMQVDVEWDKENSVSSAPKSRSAGSGQRQQLQEQVNNRSRGRLKESVISGLRLAGPGLQSASTSSFQDDVSVTTSEFESDTDTETGRRDQTNRFHQRSHASTRGLPSLRLQEEVDIGGHLSPRSLSRKMELELQYLESLETAHIHVSEIHRLNVTAVAQEESFSLMQLMKQREQVQENKVEKYKAEVEQARRERERAEARLLNQPKRVSQATLFPTSSSISIAKAPETPVLHYSQSSGHGSKASVVSYSQDDFASISDYVSIPISQTVKAFSKASNIINEDMGLYQDETRSISSYRSVGEMVTISDNNLYPAEVASVSLDESTINLDALMSLDNVKVPHSPADYLHALKERELVAEELAKNQIREAKKHFKTSEVAAHSEEDRRRLLESFKLQEKSILMKLALERADIKYLRARGYEEAQPVESRRTNSSVVAPFNQILTSAEGFASERSKSTSSLKSALKKHDVNQIQGGPKTPSSSSVGPVKPEEVADDTGLSSSSIAEEIDLAHDQTSHSSDSVSMGLDGGSKLLDSRSNTPKPSVVSSASPISQSPADTPVSSTVSSIVAKLQKVSAYVSDVGKLERKKVRLQKSHIVGEKILSDTRKKVKLEADVLELESRLHASLRLVLWPQVRGQN